MNTKTTLNVPPNRRRSAAGGALRALQVWEVALRGVPVFRFSGSTWLLFLAVQPPAGDMFFGGQHLWR